MSIYIPSITNSHKHEMEGEGEMNDFVAMHIETNQHKRIHIPVHIYIYNMQKMNGILSFT